MADRSTFSASSAPMPTGIEFLDQYADRMSQLFNNSVLPLHSIGGTGDAVTASVDPPLTAGLVAGMKFTIAWAGANAGAMTLAIGGGTALPVLDADGGDMAPFAAAPGRRALLEYVGGAFVLLGGGGEGGFIPLHWTITASATWEKPAGLDDDRIAWVRAWGAGAGGGGRITSSGVVNKFGGGGGEYVEWWFRMSELPATLSATIGAGGLGKTSGNNDDPGGDGGDTALGGVLLAEGGKSVLSGKSGGGARGGLRVTDSNGGNWGPDYLLYASDARDLWSGGGGNSTTSGGSGTHHRGGNAIYGGAGGGNTAGVSIYGGNGGGAGANGTAPGGGGGRPGSGAAGNGARGEIHITIF